MSDLVDLAKMHGVDEGVFAPSGLAPDELRDASRTAHEALGLEPAWPCAKCKASFERNTGLIREHLARVLTPEELAATIKRVAEAAGNLTD